MKITDPNKLIIGNEYRSKQAKRIIVKSIEVNNMFPTRSIIRVIYVDSGNPGNIYLSGIFGKND